MLFIPGNLLPKPREFSEPQWIKDKGKRNSGALEFFGTAQRRFGLSREEMGEKKETTPGRVWWFFFFPVAPRWRERERGKKLWGEVFKIHFSLGKAAFPLGKATWGMAGGLQARSSRAHPKNKSGDSWLPSEKSIFERARNIPNLGFF